MKNIVLDKNIFRSTPSMNSPEFKALGYLAGDKFVCIHIPFVIEHEFRSWLLQEHEKKIDDAVKYLSGLSGYPKLSGLVPELAAGLEKISNLRGELLVETEEIFLQWKDSIGAECSNLNKSDAVSALMAYFYGGKPLKRAKLRKDIPDSFIFQAILRLYKKNNNELNFVTNDSGLREACESEGVNVFSSLSEFVHLPECKNSLKNALIEENQTDVFDCLSNYIDGSAEKILGEIEALLLSDDYRTIDVEGIAENDDIYVSLVHSPHSFELSGDIEHYGEGLFVVSFTANVELTYEFSVYRSDAYDLDPDKYYLEYLYDHYFNVETTDEFRFLGRIELEYDEDFGVITTSTELMTALKKPDLIVSELEQFEINPVE